MVSLSADEVTRLSESEWTAFVSEVKACNGLERRRILHLAYERWHEREILRGLASHRQYSGPVASPNGRPPAQVFFCIDEREESMRRALEEVDPEWRRSAPPGTSAWPSTTRESTTRTGAAFCPVVVKPQHAVLEQPKAEDSALLETPPVAQAFSGLLMRNSFVSSRTLMRGWLSTAALGLLSAVPLIGHLLAPRRYARLREWLNKAFLPEPRTELTLMRNTAQSQDAVDGPVDGIRRRGKSRTAWPAFWVRRA